MIPVAEIFGPTIQGEGPNAGKKCIFVRVVGCDFKCGWCDSKFTWQANSETKRYDQNDLIAEVLNMCIKTNTAHVVVTGGNPCLYALDLFVASLQLRNIQVDVETQGSIIPNWLYRTDLAVISPKAPSSGQKDVLETVTSFIDELAERQTRTKVAIKIPIFNQEDIDFAQRYYDMFEQKKKQYALDIKFYLTVGNTNVEEQGSIQERILRDYEMLIAKIMGSKMEDVYILPQIHTLVWNNKQGV